MVRSVFQSVRVCREVRKLKVEKLLLDWMVKN